MNPIANFVKTLGAARIGAIGALAAIILGLVVFGYIRASTPEMRPLYTDLEFNDSSAIVRDLESQNIPYELRGDGATILVPADAVLRLRMQFAESGLPLGGGIGYEIFDRGDGLGATSFVQNLNHLRALEGELARTIRTIDRVRTARVHLVLPERKLFSREESEPSASIVLKLRGPLDGGQIKAIQHLVAAAVKELSPDRVSVVDDRGDLLASGLGNDQVILNASLEERKISIEQRLKQQVESIVTSVVGSGNARVQVSAQLDNRHVTETEDVYDPDGQVVRSTQSREEESNAVDRTQSGGVSASNELPSANPAGGEDGSSREASTTSEEVVNYEISKRTTTEIREAGGIRKLSVAVLVDGLYEKDASGNATYSPRPQEQIDQIAQLVRSAIGFDRERGDTVEVVNLQFAPSGAEPTLDESDGGFLAFSTGDYLRVAELLVLALVGLILVLFVVRPLLNQVLASEDGVSGALPPPREGGSGDKEGTAIAAEGESRALPATISRINVSEMIDTAKLTGEMQESSVRKIGEMVRDNPEETVSILRQWLHEDA